MRGVGQRLDPVIPHGRSHEQLERGKIVVGLRAPLPGDAHERRAGRGRDVLELLELEIHRSRHYAMDGSRS